jgi:hypothetical protein
MAKQLKFFINVFGTCLRFDKFKIIEKNIPDLENQIISAAKSKSLPKLLIVDDIFLINLKKEISTKIKINNSSLNIVPIYIDFNSNSNLKPIALLGTAEGINNYVEEQMRTERIREELKKK